MTILKWHTNGMVSDSNRNGSSNKVYCVYALCFPTTWLNQIDNLDFDVGNLVEEDSQSFHDLSCDGYLTITCI